MVLAGQVLEAINEFFDDQVILNVAKKLYNQHQNDGDLTVLYSQLNQLCNCNFQTKVGLNIDSSKLSANAHITGTQLSAGANIVGTQLSAGAGITGEQIASDAGIVGSQMAANSITSTQIQDGTITNFDISSIANIKGTQLSAGANIAGTQISAGANIKASQLDPNIATCLSSLPTTWNADAVSRIVSCFSGIVLFES